MEMSLSLDPDTAAIRYIDMTPEGRLDAVNRAINARLAIEAAPSFRRNKRAAVEALLREEDFIVRVAKSRGDAWALAEASR